jgi:hypothetical protein
VYWTQTRGDIHYSQAPSTSSKNGLTLAVDNRSGM